jgi:hypothetical protein
MEPADEYELSAWVARERWEEQIRNKAMQLSTQTAKLSREVNT